MAFQFATLAEFLYMDGHGIYVWASYLATFLAMGLLVIVPWFKRRALFIRLRRQQRIEKRNVQEVID